MYSLKQARKEFLRGYSCPTYIKKLFLEHVEHPYNLARFSGVTHTVKDANASCGDLIELQLKVEKGIIKEVKAWC